MVVFQVQRCSLKKNDYYKTERDSEQNHPILSIDVMEQWNVVSSSVKCGLVVD